MAKKKASRLSKRKEAEAAEALEKEAGTKKKKATKKKATTRRAKKKVAARKMLIWVVFNGNMKEEARFLYDQRKEAEAKIKQLRAKATKKSYFIQPMKIEIVETAEAK